MTLCFIFSKYELCFESLTKIFLSNMLILLAVALNTHNLSNLIDFFSACRKQTRNRAPHVTALEQGNP